MLLIWCIGILTDSFKIIGTGKVILIGGPSNLLNFIKTNGFADEVIDVSTSHEERIELINGMSSSEKVQMLFSKPLEFQKCSLNRLKW